MSLLDLLNQTCQIDRRVAKTGRLGEDISTWQTITSGSGRKCRYNPSVNQYKTIDGKLQYTKPQARLYVESYASLAVQEGDRVYVTELDIYLSVTRAQMDSSRNHWQLDVEDFEAIN